jgi:hypothetical protein
VTTTAAGETLGLDATVEEVHDPIEIIGTGVLAIPAVASGDDNCSPGGCPRSPPSSRRPQHALDAPSRRAAACVPPGARHAPA